MSGGTGASDRSRRRLASLIRPALAAVALLLVALAAGLAGWSGRSSGPGEAAVGEDNYPRLLINQILPGAEKYHAMVGRSFWIDSVAALKADLAAQGRSITALRYFAPRQYQTDIFSVPYNTVYTGHWLFADGAAIVGPLTASATTVQVSDASRFADLTAYYAMIWDGTALDESLTPDDPAFWAHAEHVKITGVGSSSLNIQRGYNPSSQSFAPGLSVAHSAGSRIAIHIPGADTPPEVWSYNLSTASPRDAQGRQFNQVLAGWLGQHLHHVYKPATGTYQEYPGAWDGIWFDVTNYWIGANQWPDNRADVNNDLEPDGGILEAGRSAWGEGFDVFFADTRQALGPDVIVVGGTMPTRGAAYLNGLDMEGFPGSGYSSDNYRVYSSALSFYFAWDQGAGTSPAFTNVFTRIGTDEYAACGQYGQTTDQGSNSDFRFGLGTTLLAQGYFLYTNGCFGDYWWDEYAVDLSTGSAIPVSAGTDALAAHIGYLGQPLGGPQRLLDPMSGTNLVNQNWTLSLSGSAQADLVTLGGIRTVNITSPGTTAGNISLASGPFPLVAGREYTLVYRARADNGRAAVDLGRDVTVAQGSGGPLGGAFVTGDWQDYSIDFVAATTTASAKVYFRLGGEGGTFSVQNVGVYEGASDLFRRDFTNGIAIVNGTWQSRTVALGSTFRKILGTQDPTFNNGAFVSSVTLEPHDAIILLRSGPIPTPTRTATSTPVSPPSDLRVLSTKAPPASATQGDSFSAADTTKNFGPNAAGPSTTRFYLSQDTAKGAGDVALTPDRAVPTLAAGEQSWGPLTVRIPGSTPAGTYYVLACADDAKQIPETDEGNNCTASLSTMHVQSDDLDGDGCTAFEETFGAPPPMPGSTCTSPASCYSDSTWYDFYDVPTPANPDPTSSGARDGKVDMSDVLAVLFYSSADEGGPPNAAGVAYDSLKDGDWNGDTMVNASDRVGLRYDRSPSSAPDPPAEAGPPAGSIDLADVLAVLAQFGLDCTGAP